MRCTGAGAERAYALLYARINTVPKVPQHATIMTSHLHVCVRTRTSLGLAPAVLGDLLLLRPGLVSFEPGHVLAVRLLADFTHPGWRDESKAGATREQRNR